MAYDFATNRYLQATQTNSQPLTLSAWLYPRNTTSSHTCVAQTTLNGAAWMSLHGSGPDQKIRAYVQSSDREAKTTTTWSVNTWVHAAATFSGTSPMTLTSFLDGGGKNSATQNYNPSPTGISIGALRVNNATFEIANALIAEVCIWSVVLTDDEIVSLAKGFSPRKVRPQSIRFYSPLVRELQDLRNGLSITNGNSATVATHPRIYA
jgi:hypothetical protein